MNKLLAIMLISIWWSPKIFGSEESASFRSPASAADFQLQFQVEKYELANGLIVLLYEDHSIPIVNLQQWFRVGSRNEEVGFTGIAHLFEHMMFKGTPRYPEGAFENILQANGADFNAFTSHDYTGYHESFPSDKLELMLDIESDRMRNLNINEANLTSEREVVKEERRYRVDNNVRGTLNELVYQTAYRVHPYRWPVIGWMKDLNQITLEKCLEFYKSFYAPNNAVLVLAGDFVPQRAKELVAKYYGPLTREKILVREIPTEPQQMAQRSARIQKQVQSSTFEIVYHIPKLGTDENYPIDLLAKLLGDGPSSRLYKKLVYQTQWADSVYVYADFNKDDGLFRIGVSLKPKMPVARARQAVLDEIANLTKKGLDSLELAKTKSQTISSYISQLKTIEGKAEILAHYEINMGSYRFFFDDIKKYQAVTPSQVSEMLKKYFGPQQASVITVDPQP